MCKYDLELLYCIVLHWNLPGGNNELFRTEIKTLDGLCLKLNANISALKSRSGQPVIAFWCDIQNSKL